MIPSPLDFFARLRWLDGRPLLDTIEPYRRDLFMRALYTFRADGTPAFNMVLSGRGKKNCKSLDLVLAAFFKLIIPESVHGNDALVIANDEDQAGDDLILAKKLVRCNPDLQVELEIQAKELRRRDGAGAMKILPARDAAGAHGKTAIFVGFDEIHAYRNWDILEALQPDPTRPDALTWVTSYDSFYAIDGAPLHDLKKIGKSGADPRMIFSWYSGDVCTDPAFADLSPEARANPSMASWPEGAAYLEQQRRRLPAFKFRRLHLNLPGAPSGAFLDPDAVTTAKGNYRVQPPQPGVTYHAFVDMSGGSSDDATIAIAHKSDRRTIVDLVDKQAGAPPFNPRHAVTKFAAIVKRYGIHAVTGDHYAGNTFKADFEANGIRYESCSVAKSELYEQLEPALNAGEVELPAIPKLEAQLIGLVLRGARVDHVPGEHDDFANAAAGAVWLATNHNERGEVRVGFCGLGEGPVHWHDHASSRPTIRVVRVPERIARW